MHFCKHGKEEEAKALLREISVVPRFKMLSKFVRKGFQLLMRFKALITNAVVIKTSELNIPRFRSKSSSTSHLNPQERQLNGFH
jgi:hypothetical protein